MTFKNLRPAAVTLVLAAGYLLGGASDNPAQACSGEDTYVGSVCSIAGNYCPENYLPAAGQVLAVSDYTSLFAVMGNAYGGNGTTTFALPDLRGRTPVGLGTAFNLPVQRGTIRGKEELTLTQNQLPKHNHMATLDDTTQALVTIKVSQASADVIAPGDGDYLATPGYESFVSASGAGTPVPLGGGSGPVPLEGPLKVQNAGASAPLNIETPYQVANYCIRTKGLFPPRP